MVFLDNFKKNPVTYIVLLTGSLTILVINNLFQFLQLIKNRWILLLSATTFILILGYAAYKMKKR